jgi:IS5 family transposase
MLRDRYDPCSLFDAVPRLAPRFEPELAVVDGLLDDDALVRLVRDDLVRRRPRTGATGRPSTPVEGVLRMPVVTHLHGWSDAQTERFVADGLVLRPFCRLALAPVPRHATRLRWANLVQPATLHRLLDRVVELARGAHVARGRKLRVDGAVVEADVHHPSDSTLLADAVRVLGRAVRRARAVVGAAPGAAARLFRDRTRGAAALARAIGATTVHGRTDRERERHRLDEQRRAGASACQRQVARVRPLLDGVAGAGAARLRTAPDRVAPLAARVVAQATRRVVGGETVPAADTVPSLLEPHTALIRRGTARQRSELGREVWLDEVDGRVVTRVALLAGNASDRLQVAPSLADHVARFGRPPDPVAADRGAHSPENERVAAALGVRRVRLPLPGHRSPARRAHERQRWFRRARRSRTGIEGRISLLRRRLGPRRCRDRGEAGMERWVGWGVIAHDLRAIGRTAARRAA